MCYNKDTERGRYKMNENQERLIDLAIEIMTKRANDPNRNSSTRTAYNNAVTMLNYVLEENEEYLRRFDLKERN